MGLDDLKPNQDLGEVRSRHECRNREGLFVAVALAAIGGIMAVRAGGLPLAAVGLLLAGALLWFGISSSWTPRFVLIRELGLEVHRWFRRPRSVEFSSITGASWDFAVHSSIFGAWVSGCDVVLTYAGNRRICLNPAHFKEPELFFSRVWRLCVYPGHSALLEKYSRGEEAGFGEVSATATHVRVGNKRWPWSEVAKAEISPQQIILHFKGRSWRRTLKLRKMPYAFTFMQLLRRERVPLTAFDGFVIQD